MGYLIFSLDSWFVHRTLTFCNFSGLIISFTRSFGPFFLFFYFSTYQEWSEWLPSLWLVNIKTWSNFSYIRVLPPNLFPRVLPPNLFPPNPAGQVHIIGEPGRPGIGLGTILWTKLLWCGIAAKLVTSLSHSLGPFGFLPQKFSGHGAQSRVDFSSCGRNVVRRQNEAVCSRVS